jgi:hypothetical protein
MKLIGFIASLFVSVTTMAQCNVDNGNYWGVLSCSPPPVTTNHTIQIRGTNWRIFGLRALQAGENGLRITNSTCGTHPEIRTQIFFDGNEGVVPMRSADCPTGESSSWQFYVDTQYNVADPDPWLYFNILEANWNSQQGTWDVPNGANIDWRYIVMSKAPASTWYYLGNGESVNWGRYGARPRTDNSVYQWYRPVGTVPLVNGGVGNFADAWSQNTNVYVHLSNIRNPEAIEFDTFGFGVLNIVDIDIFIGTSNMFVYDPADFNHDGQKTTQDIFSFLNAYFSLSTSADRNRNGSVTVEDIFEFLNLYFST